MTTYYRVEYRGFLQRVVRYFKTEVRARQYLAQIGRQDAIVTQEASDYPPLLLQ